MKESKIHVYPKNDLKEHNISIDCWCGAIVEGGVVVHNSLDRREDYEHAKH